MLHRSDVVDVDTGVKGPDGGVVQIMKPATGGVGEDRMLGKG